MSSKFGSAMINMIGDFANMSRSPDFKAKSDEKSRHPTLGSVDRRHSINLTVGVSDEPPPYSAEMQIRMRRQSSIPTTSGMSKAQMQNRRQSAPVQMSRDVDQLHKKMAKLRETSSLKEVTVEEEEEDSGELSEKTKKLNQNQKQAGKHAALRGSNSDPKSPAVSVPRRAVIMNNTERRGSMVFIEDDDTPSQVLKSGDN